MVRGGHQDRARIERVTFARMTDRKHADAGQDRRERAGGRRRHVEHDDDTGGKSPRKARHQRPQRLDTTGGGAHDHQIPRGGVGHRVLQVRLGARRAWNGSYSTWRSELLKESDT
jgi:hypothetical protein